MVFYVTVVAKEASSDEGDATSEIRQEKRRVSALGACQLGLTWRAQCLFFVPPLPSKKQQSSHPSQPLRNCICDRISPYYRRVWIHLVRICLDLLSVFCFCFFFPELPVTALRLSDSLFFHQGMMWEEVGALLLCRDTDCGRICGRHRILFSLFSLRNDSEV